MTDEGPRTILYVEDDPDYRDAVRAILEAGGYSVVEAATAEDGLRLFREVEPDIALVDMMMEEVDAGMNLVKELRAAGEDLPIFLLTSLGDALVQTKDWSDLGLAGVLQKPIRAETLLALLRAKTG
jgi:DNA-binding response OmpR family regulator